MSEAKDATRDIFSINVCSQCQQPFASSVARDVFHAIPCAHVFCKDCLRRVEAEQKTGTPVCRKPGCGKKLGACAEFPVAWCAQRAERIKIELLAALEDQGDVGDTSSPTRGAEAEAAPSLCAEHKLPFKAVEIGGNRLMCSECLIAAGSKVPAQTFDAAIAALDAGTTRTSTSVAMQISALSEPTFTVDEYYGMVDKWGTKETARIKAWEDREVKHVQAVAAELVQLVRKVCSRRIDVGASLLTQRVGLRASLEELEKALTSLPRDPASRLSRKRAILADRKQLSDLLAASKFAVPSTQAVLEWAELPAFSPNFDRTSGQPGGVLAMALSTEAKATMDWACAHTPWAYLSPPRDWREFPVIPKLVRLCCSGVTGCVWACRLGL